MSQVRVCAEIMISCKKKPVRNHFLTGKNEEFKNYLTMILLDFSVLPLMTRL